MSSPFSSSVYAGVCQQTKRNKESGENRTRPGRKRVKIRYPKVKEKESVSKGQSILTQVLDKGRFLRVGETLSLNPGKTLELRCKGTKIGWAYPSYLDTYNDNRLRYSSSLTIRHSDKNPDLKLDSCVSASNSMTDTVS